MYLLTVALAPKRVAGKKNIYTKIGRDLQSQVDEKSETKNGPLCVKKKKRKEERVLWNRQK